MMEKWQPFVDEQNTVRLLAFYLPQFHTIPENDEWWGKGFTEWHNVRSSTPVYDGHIQPQLPADLGFYDLDTPDVMNKQAALAQRYGIHGFCYYYYWFGGKRLLERPLERMLASGHPNFPFCLCWANENWTRRWDGQDLEILIKQAHSAQDDEAVMLDLIRYMRDPRYIRINDRPLLLVYRTEILPNARLTSARWRQLCRKEGLGEIYLSGVESFGSACTTSPKDYGFDATVSFPPHGTPYHPNPRHTDLKREALVYDYRDMVYHATRSETVHAHRFPGVSPSWDNTPRRKKGSTIFADSTPGDYQAWLEWAIRETRRRHQKEEHLVFINAWNEWAEGAVLEPDVRNGHSYLEATRNALHITQYK
jgi:lipopolysaccharide biosynthesis protein